MMEKLGNKRKKQDKSRKRTKLKIIIDLYRDGYIEPRVLWHLLGSKFKKAELLKIDETFRKYRGKI